MNGGTFCQARARKTLNVWEHVDGSGGTPLQDASTVLQVRAKFWLLCCPVLTDLACVQGVVPMRPRNP